MNTLFHYFSVGEWKLWGISVFLITISFFYFDGDNFLTLAASLIGVTSLIFNAKGNPFGQLLMVIFSILYGIISYTYSYFGEMATYLGMTAPMALISMISWMKNPYKGNKAQVKVNRLGARDMVYMSVLSVIVTAAFYFILRFFHTANLPLSTLSVTTSFAAVYLTFRRSAFYAVAYAANDLILIGLWLLASLADSSYASVVICFLMFFANDLYGFISWRTMQTRQICE